MNRNLRWGLCVLLMTMFACRPVIAIGWEEFLLLFGLMAFLFGPPLYRFMRRWENFRRHERKNK